MADIGEHQHEVEFEPFPEEVPIETPAEQPEEVPA